jgi:hypothetical protein
MGEPLRQPQNGHRRGTAACQKFELEVVARPEAEARRINCQLTAP